MKVLRNIAVVGGLMLCSLLNAVAGEGHPFIHPLFCDHVVLQRDVSVPVWGWAAPGEKITVTFGRQHKTTKAKADGKWSVKLSPMHASKEPQKLTIHSSDIQRRTVLVEDVLVGDVWICSGQSNMEMGIGACNVPEEISAANYPEIRLLTVPQLIVNNPADTLKCRWLPCSPTNITQGLWGGFSAAGYFFGREIHKEVGIPVGLIHTSWGGTVAEAWTSLEGLQPLADMKDRLDQFKALAEQSEGKRSYDEIYEGWCQKNDPGTSQGWGNSEADLAKWKKVTMPQAWEQAGLPGYDGIVWFRAEFAAPAAWVGKNLVLSLGSMDDVDTTWVNGVKVGQVNRYNVSRAYPVPGSLIRSGRNVITIRVLDTGGAGGLTGKPEEMYVGLEDDKSAATVSLAGEWHMRDSAPLAKLSGLPQPPQAGNPNVATVLYNGMIAPLVPFAVKGAIWYQGESNSDRAEQYRRLLPAMIKDWRARFGVRDFPFYIVQLAAFQATNSEPRENNWAELREAQAFTARTVPNCGLALALDIGDAVDIHPKNKLEVGRRLALCALAQAYNQKIEFSGPWYKSAKVTDQGIRVTFDHAGSGLVAKGGKLSGFAIAGEDRKFVWADAVIDGNSVVVSSPAVAKPVAVRYAWDINPICNLYNEAGLPAVPFRTDAWPMITAGKK